MDGWHGYHTKHEMCYREMLRFYLLKIIVKNATQQQKNPHSTTTVSGLSKSVEQLLNKSRFKMLQMKAWGSFDWYV